jgi:adenosylmethionine---8-amino-7-oxononanoate aminotransferase
MIECLRKHLQQIAKLANVGDVRQRGLMAGIELVEDRASKRPFSAGLRMGARICRQARERGVLLRPLGDVLVVMPPLSIDISLLDNLCNVLYDSIQEGVRGP